jgi:hypothetical protein
MDGLSPSGRHERCEACGAVFLRGQGATIVAHQQGSEDRRSAAHWLRLLGDLPSFAPDDDDLILGPVTAIMRSAGEERPLRFRGAFLGWIEHFGPSTTGHVRLTSEKLEFEESARPRRTPRTHEWPLGTITSVQPASSALHFATTGEVVGVRFPTSSVRLWTRALEAALTRFHQAAGQEITDFQPVIRTRAVTTSAT